MVVSITIIYVISSMDPYIDASFIVLFRSGINAGLVQTLIKLIPEVANEMSKYRFGLPL